MNHTTTALKQATIEIAEQFIQSANPTVWDGKGTQPADFCSRTEDFILGGLPCVLNLSLQQDEATHEWKMCFTPFDFESEEHYGQFYTDKIDSVQNLSDTIFDGLWNLFFAEALNQIK